MTDTHSGKRNVFICAGCDGLAHSARSDATTCCAACRVKANRNGTLAKLRADALRFGLVHHRTNKPDVAGILRAAAISRLCPEHDDAIMRGEVTTNEIQPKALARLDRIIAESLEARS